MTKKKTAKARSTVRKAAKARTAKAPNTHVSLVLDESGSMESVLSSTISSVNEYVGSLKGKGGMLFSLTKFNTVRTQVVQAGVPIKDAAQLTLENYRPDGGTPLFDAVGRTIQGLKGSLRKERILVAIVTDGEENQSKEFTRPQVADMIREREKAGWTFVYLGSNHDAWAAASSIGIKAHNAMQYESNNIKGAMRGLSSATMAYAATKVLAKDAQFFSAADKATIEGKAKTA